MATSWRIETVRQDRSQTVQPNVNITGAFVIEAEKGTTKPVFVNPKQEQRLIDLFGKWGPDYPQLWDVVQYNKIAPVWVSAPYAPSDTRGGVLVTSNGSESFSSDGLTDGDIDAYTFGLNEYFLLLNRSPQAYDDLAVKITNRTIREGQADELSVFDIELYKKVKKVYEFVTTYTVAMDPEGLDGFGKNIYIENVLEDNDYLYPVVNTDITDPGSFIDDVEMVELIGNTRSSVSESELAEGWDYFKQARQYRAQIFVDTTKDPSIPNIFNTLRSSYQKYSDYIIPLPMGEDVQDAITIKENDFGVANQGIKFYWNHGKVRNIRFGSNFWSPLTGRVAQKFAQMQDIYNGLAPAWIDENGHGGQLGPGIIEMEFDPSETELELMDDKGINPIIFDPSYGVMITSQRTGQTPTYLTDTSWIAHSRLFDYLIYNITNQVLIQQIVKLNDTPHRQRAESLTNTIVGPVAGAGLLYDYEVICDETNNTDEMLAQRYFVLDLALRVTPFSERIRFNFVNLGQTTTVSEFLGG